MATPQEFLYKICPTRIEMLTVGPTALESSILSDHFEYLKDLVEKEIVILAGRTLNPDPSGFGIVIFEAQSKSDARQIMQNDPAVKNGIMHAELFPYRVALISNIR